MSARKPYGKLLGKPTLTTVLIAPHVTEKTSVGLQERNQYAFRVRRDATRTDVRRAVELMFEVKVEGVQVVNAGGKPRRFGGRLGRTQDWKKAYVRLAQGQSIDYERSATLARKSWGIAMALIKLKPNSPGTRFQVRVSRKHLHKGEPYAPLTVAQNKTGARNHFGRITTRHIGGGSRQKYRLIDFRRDKDGITGVIERVEYDPNRTAHIALVLYSDGERRYILAPKAIKTGDEVRSGSEAPIKPGNAMTLRHIPVGSVIHNIELKPGRGGQLARSAGGSAQYTSREGMHAYLRLKSGEMRKVHIDCRATLGELSHDEHNLRQYGKAGAIRWRGVRPTVRGLAMNPVDHPHGGGEGKSGQGNPHPVSPWGWKTKGLKTRRNKRTDNMIAQRRK